MTGVWITLAIGVVIMFFDYRMATAPDEKDKHKRRRPLQSMDRKKLRDLFFLTLIIAGVVWVVPKIISAG
jgi:hypothetical protein